MARTAGARNRAKPITEARQDSYLETFGVAATRRSPAAVGYAGAALIDEQIATQLYMSDGLIRRVVDIPAEEMTRAGFKLENLDEALEKKAQARVQELDVMRHMNDALRWSRLFGGSVVVLGIDDGGALDQPLNEARAKGIEFLRVYDRWQMVVQTRVLDPMNVAYGEPELWQVSPRTGAKPYVVHNSRVLTFDGDAIPDMQRTANLGWGASVLQSCLAQLSRLNDSHKSAGLILERSQQAVHGIPNLGSILQARGGEENMRKRIDVVDAVRSIMNTIVIDSAETYEITSLPMTGVPDILDRFAEALSAVTAIPVYLLMGRSPGGLNATGTSNETAWYDRVASMQNDILRKPLDRIVSLILRGIGGTDGGDYELCFNPLRSASDAEESQMESQRKTGDKAEGDMFTAYIADGVMSAEEVRKHIAERYDLDLTATIEPPVDPATELAMQKIMQQGTQPANKPTTTKGKK
ncbi:MAG: phage portal protein [Burkholderiaceae bacterium]